MSLQVSPGYYRQNLINAFASLFLDCGIMHFQMEKNISVFILKTATNRGVGRGPLGHAPPLWAPKAGPLRLFGAFQSRMCLQGKVPSNDEMSLRKVPPMTTVWRPPWVKWRPPNPCPLRDFLNTLLATNIAQALVEGSTFTFNVLLRIPLQKPLNIF